MLTEDELRACAIQAEAWLSDGDPFDGNQWSAMQVVRAWLAEHPEKWAGQPNTARAVGPMR